MVEESAKWAARILEDVLQSETKDSINEVYAEVYNEANKQRIVASQMYAIRGAMAQDMGAPPPGMHGGIMAAGTGYGRGPSPVHREGEPMVQAARPPSILFAHPCLFMSLFLT